MSWIVSVRRPLADTLRTVLELIALSLFVAAVLIWAAA